MMGAVPAIASVRFPVTGGDGVGVDAAATRADGLAVRVRPKQTRLNVSHACPRHAEHSLRARSAGGGEQAYRGMTVASSVQQSFVAAWHALDRYDPTRGCGRSR